jgi:membrane protein implicated in regulation of membrane protease activity
MDQLFAAIADVRPWHWFALAALLVSVEIVSTTFYFLWPGCAAAIVGVLLYFVPSLGLNAQIVLFSVLAVVSTIVWKRFAPASWTSAEPHPTLNRRAAQYEGRRAKVAADFANGRGAILIDDTRWSAVAHDGSNPLQGETVEVTGADGTVLTVKKAA